MSFAAPSSNEPRPTTSRMRSPGGISWGWWAALGVLIVAVVVIAALALADGAEPVSTVSVAEVVTDPTGHDGERVAIAGRIDELLTDRALAVGSDLAPDDLLVLIPADATIRGYGTTTTGIVPVPAGEFYEVGDVAQFAGEVREFDRDAIAEEFGLVLNEELFGAWEDRPVLIMDRLDVATLALLSPVPTMAPA